MDYYERLYKTVHKGWARLFKTKCTCGKTVWSVDEEYVEDQLSIKAMFICPDCGRKWKATAFDGHKYKYHQAIVDEIKYKSGRERGFRHDGKTYVVLKDCIKVKKEV